jgi:hypothetical protein
MFEYGLNATLMFSTEILRERRVRSSSRNLQFRSVNHLSLSNDYFNADRKSSRRFPTAGYTLAGCAGLRTNL